MSTAEAARATALPGSAGVPGITGIPGITEPAYDHTAAHAALLSKVDLFSGLSRVALAKVAAHLDPIPIPAGAAACVQGESGDSLYIVAAGSLGVYLRGQAPDEEMQVATLGPAACFGEMALLTGETRSATVRATQDSEALRLDRVRFLELLRREPGIGLAISATLSRRLRAANGAITQDHRVIAQVVRRYLAGLSQDVRERVLRASLLPVVRHAALVALFAERSVEVAAHLAALDVDADDAAQPESVLKELRAELEREWGAERVGVAGHEMALTLLAARQWDDGLELLSRHATRTVLLTELGRAMRADPPMEADVAARWAQRVGDDELSGNAWLTRLRGLYVAAEIHAAASAELARPLSPFMQIVRQWRSRTSATIAATLAFTAAAGVASRSSPQLAFVLLLGAAVMLWITALLPDFLVCIGLAVWWVLFGIATPAQALAGFGTTSWMNALAILAIAAAISSSGLLFRFGLLLVRRMPDGLFAQAITFLLTGIILTGLLPSSTARSGLVVPLALTASSAQRLEERGPESTLLGMAAYIGANPLLFVFVNGSTSCLLALGLLPEAIRAEFDFVHWLVVSLPLTLFMAFGSLAVMWAMLKPRATTMASRAQLNLQLSLLGHTTGREMAMAVILLLTVAGWNVGPALGVPSAVVGMLGLLAAAVFGCFDRSALQGLNWDFLIGYGVILSISQLTVALGLDKAAAGAVRDALGGMVVPPVVFVLLVAVLNLGMRILLPQDQALLLLGLALVPVAPVVGVNPFIIIFTLLVTFSTWFFPSQTVGYLVARDASEGKLFTDAQAQRVCLVFTVVTLLGLALSVPYWHILGLV